MFLHRSQLFSALKTHLFILMLELVHVVIAACRDEKGEFLARQARQKDPCYCEVILNLMQTTALLYLTCEWAFVKFFVTIIAMWQTDYFDVLGAIFVSH